MRTHTLRLAFHCAALVLALPSLLAAQRGAGPQGSPPPGPMRFEFVGPASGGRFSAITGIPGAPGTYYAGAASGGVWKSTDAGATWAPISDGMTAAAIGALAVTPTNPDIVWAGTGEAWAIRDADMMGDGIYKSTDAGATWTNVGLRETGRIGRIIVHPSNPDIVYACALGRATGPQQERGVFKTTDGGQTWTRMLFGDPDTGCSGLTMDPRNPEVLFAGMWEVVMHTWAMFSGGPGSAIYMTRDGGRRWRKVTHSGLPKSPVGKIDVQIAPTNPQHVYALIQTADQGSLWRSDDGGNAWRVVSRDRRLIGRAGYYIRRGVSTGDENDVIVMSSSLLRSTDGGATFNTGSGCGDCHDVWIDPLDPDHLALTGDGGLSISRDRNRTRTNVSLPIGQMYHVAIDERAPYRVYSNRQDNGAMRGPISSPELPDNVPSYRPQAAGGGGRGGGAGGGFGGGRGGGGGPAWDHSVGGCESGFTIPVHSNPDIVWATCYGAKVTRYDDRTGQARSVHPWIQTLDSPPTELKYRCHWTAPIAVDPFEPETVYYGCQVIFRTTDGGQTWDVISPDLSTQDPTRIVSSGGIIGDNLGQFYGEVVFAIAPSKIQRGLIWAGTNDGKLWYTRDGGSNWIDVSANVGMKEWGTIRKIEPSVFDAGTAYIAVDYHMMDDREPYIYRTTDYGRTWTRISDGLPHGHPLAYVYAVAENPNRRGMLFAGTGNGFYYSLNDGAAWTRFSDGLPPAPVTWIKVSRTYHDVIVSTYGRGIYALRDITRLEQSDRVAEDAGLFAYDPRPGIRFARNGTAEFLYTLRGAPSDPVRVEILDSNGAVLRTMSTPGRAGLNRATWDLRHDGPAQVKLRTVAPDNPFIWDEPRFSGGVRPVLHWGIAGAQRAGPLASPGRYAVRITSDDRTATKPFDVVKDPSIPASDADLALSTMTQARIRDGLNTTADIANRIEIMRKQIEEHLAAQRGNRDLERALRALDEKMLSVELQLLSRADLQSDDKWFTDAYEVYLNLIWLNGEVGTGAGDMAGGADHRPSAQSLQVLDLLEQDLAKAKADFEILMRNDVPAVNRAMEGRLAPITDRLPPRTTTQVSQGQRTNGSVVWSDVGHRHEILSDSTSRCGSGQDVDYASCVVRLARADRCQHGAQEPARAADPLRQQSNRLIRHADQQVPLCAVRDGQLLRESPGELPRLAQHERE